MPVKWSWKHKIGYYTLVQKHTRQIGVDVFGNPTIETTTRKFRINIYAGNCLGVCIWDFKGPTDNPDDIDPKTGKPRIVAKYQFCGYWNDRTHLENMLGMHPKEGFSDNCYSKKEHPDDYMESIHFNTFFNCHMKDFTKVISAFTKAGIKVSFYYKEPKEDKKNGKK